VVPLVKSKIAWRDRLAWEFAKDAKANLLESATDISPENDGVSSRGSSSSISDRSGTENP